MSQQQQQQEQQQQQHFCSRVTVQQKSHDDMQPCPAGTARAEFEERSRCFQGHQRPVRNSHCVGQLANRKAQSVGQDRSVSETAAITSSAQLFDFVVS